MATKKKAVRKMKKKVVKRAAKKPARRPAKKVVRKAAKKSARKVRCAGKTKEGKRCKRMVAPPAKNCHLHKRKR